MTLREYAALHPYEELENWSPKNRADYKCIYPSRKFLCAYDAGHAEGSCETCGYFRNAEGEIYDT